MKSSIRTVALLLPCAALFAGCWSAHAQTAEEPFSFAVLGGGWDGELERFEQVVAEINAQPLAFVVYAGVAESSVCSAEAYRERREALDRIRHPVIYTPGDGDWSDCIGQVAGGGDLDRLNDLRNAFFNPVGKSLGARQIDLQTQARSTEFGEFAENARYIHGKLVVTTLHLLRDDRDGARGGDSRRRADAAIAWLYDTPPAAIEADARAGVFVLHAGMPEGANAAASNYNYDGVYWGLIEIAQHTSVPLLVIHAGSEGYVADHPYRDPVAGQTISNLQRLRTLSSPSAGWIRVNVDTNLEQPFGFEVETLREP